MSSDRTEPPVREELLAGLEAARSPPRRPPQTHWTNQTQEARVYSPDGPMGPPQQPLWSGEQNDL
eukprot:7159784-Pyramimonas_sp.AAC.1